MNLYSVHDCKAGAYLPPVCFKTTVDAIRAFEQSCQDEKSNFYLYPSDFTLVELGHWNELTAEITPHAIPIIIANASEFSRRSHIQDSLNILTKKD